ncbi:lumican isoform X1 [Siniperca chuatsi]|uniref:lumican isoform X1 n=2 Tax=Siniperca chuatsi TaxID=119488 RepID=UPI001CE0E865|nr:lumican isoform X1 [Siniperca chuatsi]
MEEVWGLGCGQNLKKRNVADRLHISPAVSMALLYCAVLVLLCVFDSASATVIADMDYGGVPLWINRLLGEPSVLSLQGRMDPAWFRANNPQACPRQCDCPIQWPTALYCDHRGPADIPDHLPDRTQYLFLQGNNISSLSSSFLANITGLRWLILDHNQLQTDTLDQAALQNQTQLCYVFANHNHLSSVPTTLPAGLKQLRLAHNQISSIGPGAFRNLHNLTLLLLQGNRLQTITEGDLKGLVSLNLLDLSGNLFSSVPRHLPPSVQQLYLSNNTLSGLDEDSFVGFLNLKYLRLSHCGLQSRSIHPQVFNFSSLVELDMSYNKLTTIPTVPTTLQYLYLEANEIQGFNMTSFCREVGPMAYSRMKILRLDGNKMSYQQLPPDWVFCLRVLESIYI